jgi:hypothetical protein
MEESLNGIYPETAFAEMRTQAAFDDSSLLERGFVESRH